MLRTAVRRIGSRSLSSSAALRAGSSAFKDVPMGPPDAILGLTEAYKKDTFDAKVNVGVGAYRSDEGKPVVLESVREAEGRVLGHGLDHEYAGIAGVPGFVDLALKFAYGADSPALAEGRVAGAQSLSGTGALRVAFAFLKRYRDAPVYIPDPTWGNHKAIIKDAGLESVPYRYYHPETVGLDFDGMCADLEAAPEGATVLLHACAHNPTGIDPSQSQWRTLSDLVRRKNLLPLFDSAYQGFASGDAERDAWALRHFVDEGHEMLLCQSFAKNFGLYGERVGTVSAVTLSKEEKERVLSQLKIVIRPMYSSPPLYGARLVQEVLSDPSLSKRWAAECRGMADRIHSMRVALRNRLETLDPERSWTHITNQIGMFCYSGLSPAQVDRMVHDHHVYMTRDGRISMAGVSTANVDTIANAIHHVITTSK